MIEPYLYVTGGIPAFLQLTESSNEEWPPENVPGELSQGDYNPQTWGSATLSLPLKAVPIAQPWNEINAFIDMGVLINVFTWLEPFYRDFRVVGVLVGTFLMGLLIAVLHKRRFTSPRVFWVQAAFISTIFLATFVPKINDSLFIDE